MFSILFEVYLYEVGSAHVGIRMDASKANSRPVIFNEQNKIFIFSWKFWIEHAKNWPIDPPILIPTHDWLKRTYASNLQVLDDFKRC